MSARLSESAQYSAKVKFKCSSCLFIIGMKTASLGSALLSFVWFEVAKGVVKRAIEVYGLTEEQAEAIRTVFLRPNDFRVTAES
jgi:hypothetical protein